MPEPETTSARANLITALTTSEMYELWTAQNVRSCCILPTMVCTAYRSGRALQQQSVQG
jgi:hypothetical protein